MATTSPSNWCSNFNSGGGFAGYVNRSSGAIAELAEAESISEATLYNWRKAARAEGRRLPNGDRTPAGWCARDKFAAVVETAALNEAERSVYCRQNGLYPEQIHQWREAWEQANDWDRLQLQRLQESRKTDEPRIKEWERELRQKENALVETAALVVLRKNPQAIGEDGEDGIYLESDSNLMDTSNPF